MSEGSLHVLAVNLANPKASRCPVGAGSLRITSRATPIDPVPLHNRFEFDGLGRYPFVDSECRFVEKVLRCLRGTPK